MGPEDIRATVYRFDPHNMADSTVRTLATGRDSPLAVTLKTIDENRAGGGANRHLMLIGPRGMGKSFFLRLVQVALKDRGSPDRFLLLPEEQPNLTTAAALPRELHRLLTGAPAASLMPRLGGEPDDAWETAVAELDAAIAERLGAGSDVGSGAGTPPLAIAAIENFDRLLERAFKSKADQSRLRAWLDSDRRVMLIVSTLAGDLDQRYGDRLFHSFEHLRLEPWDTGEYLDYFRRRAGHERRQEGHWPEAKVRAISAFTGGSPRMAVILADLLRADGDPVSAAQTLDALVDNLTPYYQDLIWERMPDVPRALFDALIRGGEPCSQSELAERVGLPQNRIAQPFSWLRENEIVFGEREHKGRATLYRVADRVLVQFYKKRHLDHRALETPLAAMAEFLATFYRRDELRAFAIKLFARGQTAEASVFARVQLEQSGHKLADCPALAEPALLRQLVETFAPSNQDRDDPARLETQLADLQARLDQAEAEDQALRGMLLERIGWLSMKLGRAEPALEAHRLAIAAFEQAGNARHMAWNWMTIGGCLAHAQEYFRVFDKDPAGAEDAYQRACRIAAEADARDLAAEASYRLGLLHLAEGETDQARAAFSDGLGLARAADDGRWQAANLEGLAQLADRQARPDEALSLRQQALEATRRNGHPDALAVALGNLGWNHWALGQPGEALAAHREALPWAEQAKREDLIDWNLQRTAEAAAKLGDEAAEADAWRQRLARLDRRPAAADSDAWRLAHRAAERLRQFQDRALANACAEDGLASAVAAGLGGWALGPLLKFLLPAWEAEGLGPEQCLDRLASLRRPGAGAATDWESWAEALEQADAIDLALLAHRRSIASLRADPSLPEHYKAGRETWLWVRAHLILRDRQRYDDAIATLTDALAFAANLRDRDPTFGTTLRGLIAAMHLLRGADAEAWRTLDAALGETPDRAGTLLQAMGSAVPTAERNAGKPAAFAIGRRLIGHLLDPPTDRSVREPSAAKPKTTPLAALTALFVGLLQDRPSDDLLRDLAHELKVLSPAAAPTAEAVLLTLDYLAQDRSPAVLERAEPDIAIAVRALVAELDAAAGGSEPA
jgi:tetratricopeptide (TPR) repeat protein